MYKCVDVCTILLKHALPPGHRLYDNWCTWAHLYGYMFLAFRIQTKLKLIIDKLYINKYTHIYIYIHIYRYIDR